MIKGRLLQKIYCNVKEARHPGQWRELPLNLGFSAKASGWWEGTPKIFAPFNFLVFFQKCKYINQAIPTEMYGQSAQNKEKR